MIDYELGINNLLREDSTKVLVKGANINVEYRLHKDEFVNPEDPLGTPNDIWCLHIPQINQTYLDASEELVFEALHEFFEEDFVRFYALRLIEEREKKQNGK